MVLHEPFEAHLDRIPTPGAVILNVYLPAHYAFRPGVGTVYDPDAIVRLAEKSEHEAAMMLLESAEVLQPELQDWPDELAAALIRDAELSLSFWSDETGISAWTLSRGFAKVFGISPSAFRARARIRQAWRAIQASNTPMSAIAAEYGFADQAHMSRGVKTLTGHCPTAWRSCK